MPIVSSNGSYRLLTVILFSLVFTKQLFAQPTITSFSPVSGAQRDTITITGTNFVNIQFVQFGGTNAASYTVVNSTTIKAVLGYGASGNVFIYTPTGQVSKAGFIHTGPPPPTISAFTPATGDAGTTVTISGTNFNTVPGKNLVYFGKARATVSAATSTSLSVTAPGGATYEPLSVTANDFTAYANAPFRQTFTGGGFMLPGSFDKNKDLQTGGLPFNFCIGDIDGDGKPDIVVSEVNDRTFSVFKNTSTSGSLSFANRVSFPVMQGGWSVALGDLNGDGKPDVIVSNSIGGQSSISIFQNTSANGAISFAARKDYSTGASDYSYPERAAVMDLDNDGRPDVAVANSDNTVSVFRNTSNFLTASLASKQNYPIGRGATGIIINDLDGDNKPDIATANSSSNDISVLKNTSITGVISFGATVNLTAASGPYDIAAGDLDNDGKPDLAVVNANDGNLSIFKNNSTTGAVSFQSKTDYGHLTYLTGVAMGDLDGDGKADVAAAQYGTITNYLSVFRNTSSNGAISLSDNVQFTSGGQIRRLAIADMDGDGIPDIIAANSQAATISVLRNKVQASHITSFSPMYGGTGTTVTIKGHNFINATAVSFGGQQAASFTIVSDSVLHAVVAAGASGEVKVVSAAGPGTASGFLFTSIPVVNYFEPLSGKVGSTVTITGANFSPAPGNNTVYFGGVKATVLTASANKLTVTVPAGTGNKPVTVTTANRTAYADKAFTVTFPGAPATFLPSSFESKQDITIPGTNSVYAADLDLDGKPDLIATNGPNVNTISVLRNTSVNGLVSFAAKVDLTTQGPPISANTCDFDGDGKLDMVTGVWPASGTAISVHKNTSTTGAISFAPKIDLSLASFMHAIGDIDGDGKPDIATIDFNNYTLNVYKNTTSNGNISFSVKNYAIVDGNARGMAICDFNGDGKPEVVVTLSTQDVVYVFPNNSSVDTIRFGQELIYATGDGPLYGVATGDVDGDGKPDITVENYNGSSFSVLKNTSANGILSFAAKVDFTTATNPVTMEVGDLDGDGKPDAALVHHYVGVGQTVSLLKNISNPDIAFAAKLDLVSGTGPNSVCLNDLDADGKPELVIANYKSNTVSIFRNKVNEPAVAPAGTNPVNGQVIKNIIIDPTVQTYNGQPYVQRHYEIEPANDPATATALVTLYFTQQEFDNFNAHPAHGAGLPANATDAAGIANIRIYQYHGFSATSVPGSYSGDGVEINPDDNNVIWNSVAQWWEVTFPVTGFSGFFVSSAGFKYKQPAALTVSAGDVTTFCAGGNVLLTASTATNYQWYKDGAAISNAQDATYQATESGNYTVTTKVDNIASPSSNTISVIVKPVPAKPVITLTGSTLSSSAATGNQWYRNGTLLAGATNQTYKPDSTGNYTVIVTGNGCKSVASANYYFAVTGVINIDNEQFIRFSPNPVTDRVYVTYNLTGTSSINIQIINIQGKVCRVFNKLSNGNELSLNGLPNGVYVAKVFNLTNRKSYTIRLLKL
ncbi:MAG TPA: FG-GAP-like repeat-containing protein [Niastella sp.]